VVGKTVKRIYMGLIFLFLYAPILVLIIYSFNESKSRGHWGGFTLKWYDELFRDPAIIKALYYTFLIALLSSLISTIIGTLAAIGIHNLGTISKKIVLNINYLPVLVPDIVTGVALMTLFISMKMNLGFLTMLISHVMFNIPYVILSVLPKLRQMNRHITEAALDLGAKPFYALYRVVIPEIMPGVVTGAIIAFTLSIDDFVISFFNTGSGVTNLSIVIFSRARRGIKPTINALSTLMLITVAILLLVINKRTSKGDELIP
jgi:spermidine/putrescine transport system permease protein